MRQRTYGGVGSPAREGGLTRLHNKLINFMQNSAFFPC
jgi:hypothetical protein